MSECTNGELRDLLPELVNGQLDAEMQRTVEAHVAACEECADEVALLRSLRPALMRGPVVDTRKIAEAVHAQGASRLGRDAMRPRVATPWRIAIAALALLAVSAIGYAVVRRGGGAEEVAAVHTRDTITGSATPQTAPAPAPEQVATPRSAPVPPQQVAVASPRAAAPSVAPAIVASVSVLDNLSDLSDDDVRVLTASLDRISPVPDVDPSAGVDPLGASLDDNSSGGT